MSAPTQPRYEIEVTSAAARDLKSLQQPILRRVDARILSLADNPRPSGAIKLQGQDDLYRVRVGDYRILYVIDDARLIVTIARVRHRRDVYRGLD